MARTSAKDGGAERIMIVTATSGDTGKAALAGFADAPGTGITVFYPEGKVSRVQNLQMSTQEAITSPSAVSAATSTTPECRQAHLCR